MFTLLINAKHFMFTLLINIKHFMFTLLIYIKHFMSILPVFSDLMLPVGRALTRARRKLAASFFPVK